MRYYPRPTRTAIRSISPKRRISSNRGREVTVTRDQKGRITQITDPRGYSLTYVYDGNGDLVDFYDRNATVALTTDPNTLPTMQFTYRTDKPHYVNAVYDALGRAPHSRLSIAPIPSRAPSMTGSTA